MAGDVDTKEHEALNLFHYSPIDENGGVLSPHFLVVHNHLLCLGLLITETAKELKLGKVLI